MITEEHRRHLSESHMGIKRMPEALGKARKTMKLKWKDPEYRRKVIQARMGHFTSEKTKRKLSLAHISISPKQEERIINLYQNGLTGDEIKVKLNIGRATIYGCLKRNKIKRRPNHIRNGRIPWNKDLKLSEEQKAGLNMEGLEQGRAWNKGIPASKESIDRLRIGLQNWINLKGYYPNWQGGISFEPYSPEFNDRLKYEIRKRDKFICQFPNCGKKENGKVHDCHHINYIKKDSSPENLIALCSSCHMKTNGNRNYWENYFKILIKSKFMEN